MTINKAQEIRFEKIVEKLKRKHFADTNKLVKENLYEIKRTPFGKEITFKIAQYKYINLFVSYDILLIEHATWSITKDEINQYLTKLEEVIS
jgi:hypothetical protein